MHAEPGGAKGPWPRDGLVPNVTTKPWRDPPNRGGPRWGQSAPISRVENRRSRSPASRSRRSISTSITTECFDAVQITETVEFETGGADLVEKIRELDTGIGADGVPTTVTVTDTVTIDTDHDGVPDATDVTTLTVHPAAESDAR